VFVFVDQMGAHMIFDDLGHQARHGATRAGD
jgi:hypothetical protein